ncbi:Blue-light-activated histidine kinase 2 [Roseobacter fucihabitans]|uniref:Blue-light-activated histidine kinase 2 n=1 Tax=Roseobacter fucihabitans TaxID=1537242 RepID=A0ABZ2BVL1_9RHOB|nr:PAS domain-containing protein [Roseobacter litoralis]MBC6965658.1 Blue-light-activated histidine kinase 2 [Roseobacter litoralis]
MADTLQKLILEDTSFDGFSRTQVPMVVSNPHLEDNPLIYANHAFTVQTGYARRAVIGRNCRFLQGEDTDITAVNRLREAVSRQESVSVDILNYRANGEAFMNRLLVAPIMDRAGALKYFVGIQKELTSGKSDMASDRVQSQLSQVQDRVETDMSLIIGMVRRKSSEVSVPSEYAALTRRIETFQLLYEEMKLSDGHSNRDSIHLGSYLSRLCCAIGHVYGRSGVRLTLQLEPIDVPIETASRVGMVTSEVLTNAFQHAFERLETGLVEVRMSQLSGGGFRIMISDDGLGLPGAMAWPDPATVGGQIISGLIEGLEGTLHLRRGAAGSIVTIDVPAGASLRY